MARNTPWKPIAAGMMAVFLAAAIGRGMVANGDQISAKDQQKAQRTVVPLAGSDERAPLPAAGAAGGNGIVEPADRETKLAGDASGRIAVINVKEGDFVKAGAELASLDAKVEEAALAAAEGDLASAKADADRTLEGQRAEDVQAAVSEANSAKARAELSQGVLERTARLAKTGASTYDELDRARRQASSDQETYKAALARQRAAERGSRAEDIASANARLTAATARRDQAKAALDRLKIVAPIDGEILQLKMRIGEYYNPAASDPFLVLGDTRKLRVRLDIDERDVARIALGMAAYVTADAFPGKRFAGKVVEIGRRMGRKNVRTDDPTERIDTKILEVVVDLDESQGLIPGLRVVGYVGGSAAG
jgi:multidrug resistance efflux pump